jgi:putative tryptophan/tyrosine transport system substrate-binding protein
MLSIGFLVGTTCDAWEDEITAFNDRLVANGWTEGTDFKIEYQPASGQKSFYTTIASDFANTKRPNPIGIIVTGGTDAATACAKATTTIPIVYATSGEGSAYFAPYANVTGISNEQCDPNLVTQRLNHMKTYLPPLLGGAAFTTFGLIGNANAQNVTDEMAAVMAPTGAASLKLTAVQATLNTVADIPTVIQEVQAKGAQALYVCTDPLITSNADIVNQHAATAGLPTMHAFRKNLGKKGTMFWGPKLENMFSQAADFVYTFGTTGILLPPATASAFEHIP